MGGEGDTESVAHLKRISETLMSNSSLKGSRLTSDAHKRIYCIAYIGVRGLLSGLVSGGINYAIAFLMYKPPAAQPHAFRFPSTIVGDLFVTSLLQGVLIWMITSMSVFGDLRTGIALPTCLTAQSLSEFSLLHASRSVYTSDFPIRTTNVRARLVLAWIPLQTGIDALQPGLDSAARLQRMRRNLRLAGLSAVVSLPVYMGLGVAVVFGAFGIGYYERVVAFWIKAAFGAICGFVSGTVVTWLVISGAQVERGLTVMSIDSERATAIP